MPDNENQNEYHSEKEPEKVLSANPNGQGLRTMQRAQPRQNQRPSYGVVNNQQMVPAQEERITGNKGGRTGATRESKIKDRPARQETRDDSKVELDLEVEVHLYAKVKVDVTIGLME